jgi:hypothetical protein
MVDESRSSLTYTAPRIEPAGLIGAWVNTESSPRGILRVVIERRPNALGISTLGAGGQAHEDWGWTHADALYAASASAHDAVAFTAAHTVKSMPVVLQANVSKGLLIVSSFQTRFEFGDPEARFAREFFRKAEPETLKLPKVPSHHSAPPSVPRSLSASTFVGTWRNTNSEGSGIASVSFESQQDGAQMRAFGRNEFGLHDWGTTAVEIYTEVGATSEPAKIKAHYDLGSIDLLLHGWVKQGVLVLALFRRFTDERGQSNYFDREFFYRADDPALAPV